MMAVKKRFYKEVSFAANADNWLVQLDGRDLRSPSGKPLSLPGADLADAIASEWAAQGDEVDPASMPIFSLAVTVIDRVVPQRPELVRELAAYGNNDLLCYRADQDDLASRQAQHWQPWLDWLSGKYGIGLEAVAGIMPFQQTESIKFNNLIDRFDDWRLGILYRSTTLSGSLVLGLGFVDGELDCDRLFDLAFLEELWQNEKWGKDFEAADRQDRIRGELCDAARFLNLLPTPVGR